ncbi:MAG TPA: ABC transporter transmembrane domain-containing protein, partial [Dyella sp.]|nr:ABC transporter transmembrane domain-containing protein [Dyella sp.]
MSNRSSSAASMLQSLGRTLTSAELAKVAAYVALSVVGAFAGSLAAVCLVPLVQPGHVLVFGNGIVNAHSSVEKQIVVFSVIALAFALCRWEAARLGAELVSRCAINLRGMVHARLIDAPLASLSDATSAEIANVLTHNVEIIVQGYSASLQLLIAAVTSMVSVGFALWVSPPLMLATPLIAVLGIVVARAYGREQS